jgi:hypothetical protein
VLLGRAAGQGHRGPGPPGVRQPRPGGKGQILDLDQVAAAEQHRPGDDVAQFPDIPRPGIVLQASPGRGAEAHHRELVAPGFLLQEMLGQQQDVVAPFPEGRQGRQEHRQAVIEVPAEAALGQQLGQILVGGTYQPDIHLGGDIAPQGLHFPLLQNPQQTGLHPRVQIPHFVQKQGAPVGLLKFAQAAAGRAGEGALQVAEELAGGQLSGQQGAVDPVKGLGAPGTQGPEGLSQ